MIGRTIFMGDNHFDNVMKPLALTKSRKNKLFAPTIVYLFPGDLKKICVHFGFAITYGVN